MFHRCTPLDRAAPFRARRSASVVAAFLVLALVAGCGGSGPTPISSSTPSSRPSGTPVGPTASPTKAPDPAAVYASIEEQVRAIRGLPAKAPVDPKVLDDAGIKKFVQETFAKENPPALVAANERLLKALGLLDASASLGKLYVDLLGSQVAGLYSADDKALYVVSKSGGLGPIEKTTFAHEYTHALQDQNFNLKGLRLDQVGEGDRAIARLSLVEGDATLTMSLWQIANLTQADLLQLLSQSLDPEVTRVLTEMPPILRESLLFPYQTGLAFVQGLQSRGWDAVDAAFKSPPATTEQILHPEKYDAHEAAVPVALPNDLSKRMGAGWSVGLEDTLGEFQMGVWLRQAGSGGTQAAAGWGGDRIAILDGPNSTFAVVLSTAWDTTADATEFDAQARKVVAGLTHPGDVLTHSGGKTSTVIIASSRDLVTRLENVLGLAG